MPRWLVALVLAGSVLLAGAEVPPQELLPDASGRIEVSANSLQIQPGTDVNYLRFGQGVRIKGEGFSLSAETVEIDVATEGVIDTDAIELPTLDQPPERVIADPGGAVQQMAREIRGPTTNLEAVNLRRIAASGDVLIEGQGMRLSTETIYSIDGGQTWSTSGRAQISIDDRKRGQRGSFSADLLSFNTATQSLIARGRLSGSFRQGDEAELTLQAAELHGSLAENQLELGGEVEVAYGSMRLTAQGTGDGAAALINLQSQRIELDGPFKLTDASLGIDLSGDGLSGAMGEGQEVSVERGVLLRDAQRGLELRASRLTAVLEPLRLEISGDVRIAYGKSSYESEQAVVTREGEGKQAKYIIEMTGPQTGRLDIEGLRPKDEEKANTKEQGE